MANRPKGSQLKGATFLVIGIIVTIASLVLNSQTEANKFALFIILGVGLILFGIFRMQQEKNRDFRAPEWNSKGFKPTDQGRQAQSPGQQAQRGGIKVCPRCRTKMPMRANYCAMCGTRI